MKNFILLFSLISLLTSCNDKDHSHEVQTNGFTTNEGQTIMMGSQSSVDVFKEMDKAWGARDYDLLKTFIADDSDLRFENGKTASNGDEFVAIIESEYQTSLSDESSEWGWVNTYAFSIKPTNPEGSDYPNNKGEGVAAGFDGSDGFYMEWYQIENGKIITWTQTKALPVKE